MFIKLTESAISFQKSYVFQRAVKRNCAFLYNHVVQIMFIDGSDKTSDFRNIFHYSRILI